MADNFTTKDATGSSITGASDNIAGVNFPRVKLNWGVDGATVDASATDPLPVVQTGTPSLATGASTAANQTTGNTSLSSIDSKTPGLGQALAANSTPVVLTAAQITTLTPPTTVTANLGTLNGAATAAKQPALGTAGSASSDVLSVQGVASMTPLKTDGSATTQPVSGTVTVTQATGTNLHIVVDSGTVTTVSTVTNLSQLGGAAIAMGTGVRSSGTQRVTIATDDVVPASQSGTWTVQPGNTANTTPWLSSLRPGTSGGLTPYHLVSAASTNATNIKASAGQVFGWYIFNSNASSRKLVFHDNAGTPTPGAGVYFSLVIPAGSAANVFSDVGVTFSSGIAISTVTGLADSDNTAVGLNDLIIDIFYK